jgi:hypothetical protein
MSASAVLANLQFEPGDFVFILSDAYRIEFVRKQSGFILLDPLADETP